VNNVNTLPIPERDRLLMAFACCEWAAALTHLTALRQVGCRVSDETFVHVGDELTSFTALWMTTNGAEWTTVEAVEHASGWLTERTEELDALLKEVGMSDQEEV
jgi:hypothetical protein